MAELTLLDNSEAADETVEEVTPEPTVISEVKNFTDGEGRTVIGQYPIDNPDNPTFIGAFMVGTNMGPVRLNMEFDEGLTLQECFETFDAAAQATVENAQKEASDRSLIMTPDQLKGKGGGIIT